MHPHAPDGDIPGRFEGPGLERYRLGRLLGRGGMGEVYLARDLDLERDVAIKFVSRDKAVDGDTRCRVLREAQAAARLDHPSICTVHETGETADGRPFIVMQYVDGEPLSTCLERGPLPVREALLLAAQAADALGAAHRQHIVHRDLKPGNVMLMPNGRLKLLDFGIAKHLVRSGDGGESPTRRNIDRFDCRHAGVYVAGAGAAAPRGRPQRPVLAWRVALRMPDRPTRV
jgi:serine/threonine protein kinase